MHRVDIVKDDSGSCAVFTERTSSASQMTAAKVMDVFAKLRGYAGQAADAVDLYPSEHGGRSSVAAYTQVRVSRYLDTSTTTQVAQILVQH